MDPNATLAEIRELQTELRRVIAAPALEELGYSEAEKAGRIADLASRLADLTEALDEWLTNGGFKPADWAAA